MIIELIAGVTLVIGLLLGVIYYLHKRLQRVTLKLHSLEALNDSMKKAAEAENRIREKHNDQWQDNNSRIESRTFFNDQH